MGLQIFDGWDLYPASNVGAITGVPWSTNSSTQKTISTTQPRNGRASFRSTNGTSALMTQAVTVGAADIIYMGCAIYHDNYTNVSAASAAATTKSVAFNVLSGGIARIDNRLQIGLSGNNGEYSLSYNGTTLITSGPNAINVYHSHMVKYNNASGDVDYYIDGVLVGSDNTGASNITIQEVSIGSLCGNGFAYLDDFWFWTNPSGAEQSALEALGGDLAVIYGVPDANGATQDWSNSGGGSAFQDIDELPASTADYIEAAAAADVSTFDIADISTSVFQVFGVAPVTYMRKETAGAGSVDHSIIANGTAGAGTTEALATTEAWYTDLSNVGINPDTGVAWAPADLATLGVRYERTA